MSKSLERASVLLALAMFWLVGVSSARADDLTIQLGSGDDFVIRDSLAFERWRIDEGGELSISGTLFLHSGGTASGVALGQSALDAHITGADNVAIGGDALGQLTNGNDNIALGDFAGNNLGTGSNNIYIGADAPASSESFQIRIGTDGLHADTTIAGQVNLPDGTDVSLSGDGALMLGNKTGLNTAFDSNEIQARNNGSAATLNLNIEGGNVVLGKASSPQGRVQIPWISANAQVFTDGSSFLFGTTSTRRHKRDLQPFEDDYEKLLELQPYTFEYRDAPGFPDGQFMGYMAEDFDERGMSALVVYDGEGRPANIRYDQISVYLVELVKRQRAALADQRAENGALASRIDALEARLAALEAH